MWPGNGVIPATKRRSSPVIASASNNRMAGQDLRNGWSHGNQVVPAQARPWRALLREGLAQPATLSALVDAARTGFGTGSAWLIAGFLQLLATRSQFAASPADFLEAAATSPAMSRENTEDFHFDPAGFTHDIAGFCLDTEGFFPIPAGFVRDPAGKILNHAGIAAVPEGPLQTLHVSARSQQELRRILQDPE